TADAATEQLAAVWRSVPAILRVEGVIGIQSLIAEEAVRRAVDLVGSRLSDHIDGGAFAAPVGSGEALRADLEFFDCLQRQLHPRTAYGVVLVVDAVYCEVNVAPARSVDTKNRIPVLCGIVGIHLLDAGGQIGQVTEIAPVERKAFNLLRVDIHAYVGLGL